MDCPYCTGWLAMADQRDKPVVTDGKVHLPSGKSPFTPPFEIYCQSCGQLWQEAEQTDDEAMTPAHPRWKEFITRLEGPEGCDFKENENKEVSWRCAGGADKSLANAILQAMGGVNIPASLKYFVAHGGYCDCEILFNVDKSGGR